MTEQRLIMINAAEAYLRIKDGVDLPTVKYKYKRTYNYFWRNNEIQSGIKTK